MLPTKLPREEFYKQFARALDATTESAHKAMTNFWQKRKDFCRRYWFNTAWFYARTWRYQRVHRDYRSFLRDEEGLLNGPGAKRGVSWEQVVYPDAEENGLASKPTSNVVQLRIPKGTWADRLPPIQPSDASQKVAEPASP